MTTDKSKRLSDAKIKGELVLEAEFRSEDRITKIRQTEREGESWDRIAEPRSPSRCSTWCRSLWIHLPITWGTVRSNEDSGKEKELPYILSTKSRCIKEISRFHLDAVRIKHVSSQFAVESINILWLSQPFSPLPAFPH
jgi:hypothetical protein